MAQYHVESFGCRASQADGDAIAAGLERLGLVPAPSLAEASVVVVNTCSVTAEADRDARAYIRRARRANAHARIVVTGCYAQRAPREVGDLPGVAIVVGNSHKDQVAALAAHGGPSNPGGNAEIVPLESLTAPPLPGLSSAAFGAEGVHPVIFAHSDFSFQSHRDGPGQAPAWPAPILSPHAERTRPSLKIQEGCGNRCSFCIIPTTRGPSRSLPRDAVLRAVEEFAAHDGVELVLSGIDLGRWGRDLALPERFADLVAEILQTTRLPRLRISSVEPMDWERDLIALLSRYGQGEHPRLARHAHLPLQSGSDTVLRRMRRRYRPWHYAEKVTAIRAALPQAAIGADVMVGFPGESDAEFRENYDFIAALPFTYLHLFPFSARPGTPAWGLHQTHPVPPATVQERMAALRQLIEAKNHIFRQSLVGLRLSVVTLESGPAPGALARTAALSDNFVPIQIEGAVPANRLLTVEVLAALGPGRQGSSASAAVLARLADAVPARAPQTTVLATAQ